MGSSMMKTLKSWIIRLSCLIPVVVYAFPSTTYAQNIFDSLSGTGTKRHLISEEQYLSLCDSLKHYAPYIGVVSIIIGILVVLVTHSKDKAKLKVGIRVFIIGIPVFLFIVVYAVCIAYGYIYLD